MQLESPRTLFTSVRLGHTTDNSTTDKSTFAPFKSDQRFPGLKRLHRLKASFESGSDSRSLRTPAEISDRPNRRSRSNHSRRANRWARRLADSPVFDLENDGFVQVGHQVRGTLNEFDEMNNRRYGRYADDYLLIGDRDGQVVSLKVRSRQFDTYLQVLNAETGELVTFNDDNYDPRYSLNSRLQFQVEAGTSYLVRVTSYFYSETGNYTLDTQGSGVLRNFSYAYGHGMVDAAAAVARAAGNDTPFDAVNDLGGKFWGLDAVNAPESWAQGHTGDDVVVAVLDTGVDYDHPDLRDNMWQNAGEIPDNGIDDDGNGFVDDVRGWNFADGLRTDVSDDYGHGTHVAGTIAAANNDRGVTGVAPDAQIMPVRVIGGWSSRSFDSRVAAGIRYAVDNGADVISMSIGNYPGDPPMRRTRSALRYARDAGVVAVMASGNERGWTGARNPIYPAAFAEQDLGIAVGAVNQDYTVAPFSNPAGDKESTFVVAPGVNVRSTLPDHDYGNYRGTSMATPHVAGVVALMLSANPNLSPERVEHILTQTAGDDGVELPTPY